MTHRTSLSAALSIERTNRGLTQSAIANLIGVQVATYRNWETGRYMPHVDQLVRLAQALEVAITYDQAGWRFPPCNGAESV